MFIDVEKVKGFLTNPTDSFKKERKTTLEDSLIYYLKVLVIFAVLGGIMGGTVAMNPVIMVLGIIIIYIMMTIGSIIGGLILHLGVYIVGGNRGLSETIKSVLFAQTPHLLIGWIPFVGFLTMIWSFILEILGLKELQDLSTGKAIVAIIIPAVIIIAIVALFAGVALISYLAMFGMPEFVPVVG